MKKLTIAHLSDLHICESTIIDQQIIFDALFSDLTDQIKNGKKFDLIFFTGDLIAKGRYSDINKSLAKEKFILPLLNITNLSSDRLIIVPGNHDIELPKLPSHLKIIFDSLSDTGKVNELIENIDNYPYLWSRLESFNSFVNEISTAKPEIKNLLFSSYKIETDNLSIGICGINSAWRAMGLPNDGDYGKILIGQRQIDLLCSKIQNCDIKIALIHHPISWLAPFDMSKIKSRIQQEFNGIFFGHNHNPDSFNLVHSNGSLFFSNSGCLYQSREYFNGYSIIEYTHIERKWHVFVREYYDSRKKFDISTRFAENGESEFFNHSNNSPIIPIFPSEEWMAAIHENVNNFLLSSIISETAPKNIKSIFIEPPLSHLSERKIANSEEMNRKAKYLSLREIINKKDLIFFIGRKESGKTTLLHYICLESHNADFLTTPQFGVYIDFSTVKKTESTILDGLIGFSKGECKRSDFVNLLKNGRMTICFDNFLTDNQSVKLIQGFINKYPKNKYIFSLQEDTVFLVKDFIPPEFHPNFDVIYIHSFGRKQIRLLAEKWFENKKSAHTIDSILLILRNLNIPRTPFIISVLLWIIEKNISFDLVNQAEIIDTLIDGMLDKFKESKARSSLDSNLKRHFLTELSYTFYLSRKKTLTHNELDQFAADYFRKKLLPSPSGPFIDELKDKGILQNIDGGVCFKFDCLRAFFLSTKMKDSKELLSSILTEDEFFKYSEELDYFTGKYRDQADVLQRSMKIIELFFEQLNLENGSDLSDFDNFDNFDKPRLIESPINLTNTEILTNQIFDSPLSSEERDEILDDIDDMCKKLHDKEENIDKKSNDISRFIEALRIVSIILRNSELIDDANLKRDSYKKIVFYWSKSILIMLKYSQISIESKQQLIDELFPEMDKSLLNYIVKLLIPNVISILVKEVLGTSKLQIVIRENIISDNNPTIIKLIGTILYADLALPDWLNYIENILKNHGKNRLLVEIIYLRLLQFFLLRSLNNQEIDKIRNLIGNSYIIIQNYTGSKLKKDNIKAWFLQQIDKNRLQTKKNDKNLF